MMNKDDALQEYLDSLYAASPNFTTQRNYRISIVNKNKVGFRDFIQRKYEIDEIELLDKIKKAELDVYKILQEFVIFLDENDYSSNSIQTCMAAVKGYLKYLGIQLRSKDFKLNVRLPKNIYPYEEPITSFMISQLIHNLPPELQTVVLVLTASGLKISELVQLKLSDINFKTNPTTIKIRSEISKITRPRETFLTSEATRSLKDYLKMHFKWIEGQENLRLKNKIIFEPTSLTDSQKIKESKTKMPQYVLTSNLLSKTLSYYIGKYPELDEKNLHGRRKISLQTFRKFFKLTVGNACGRDYAEALIGNSSYLDAYYNLPETKRSNLYLKAEPYLTISDFSKVEKIQDASGVKNNLIQNYNIMASQE